MAKIRPAVKVHGGKFYLSPWIISFLPEHHTYTEPYGAMGSVLLNKPVSPVEVFNDIDVEIINFFRVLRERYDDLIRVLSLTPYAQAEFELARQSADGLDDLERARRFFVRSRLSMGGRGEAFSYTLHRVRRGMADVVSAYLSAVDEQLPLIAERLLRVQILNMPAVEVIRKWDSPTTAGYLDPPYCPETRASPDVYRHEMTIEQHGELLDLLVDGGLQGKYLLSGYDNDLYNRRLKGWRKESREIPNHSAGGKTKAIKTEVLWLNF